MATVIAPSACRHGGQFLPARCRPNVPPGDYTAPIEPARLVPAQGSVRPGLELPVDDEPWDDRIPLRREDLYGDDDAR